MTALLLVCVLSAAPGGYTVGGVSLRVDPAWTHSTQGDTHRFAAPDGETWFEVDSGKVQTAGMEPGVCVQKILRALGGKFEPRTVGGQPAAYGKAEDKDKKGKRFVTDPWVGCDGKTTWSVTGHRLASAEGVPVVEGFVKTLAFVKGGK